MNSKETMAANNLYQPDILIIDDDPTMSRILLMILGKAGYGVRAATSARSGLNEALRKTPDAIVLDYMLPDRSGLELLIDFRNTIDLEDVPVIMLTASSETSIVRTAIVGGVNDYLLKPVEPEILLDRLKTLLGDSTSPQTERTNDAEVADEKTRESSEDSTPAGDAEIDPEEDTSDSTDEEPHTKE